MIMDGLDTLSQVALADVSSFCFDTTALTNAGRHASESFEDSLNTPVTTCSETSFFGPDTLEPPPITATGRCLMIILFYFETFERVLRQRGERRQRVLAIASYAALSAETIIGNSYLRHSEARSLAVPGRQAGWMASVSEERSASKLTPQPLLLSFSGVLVVVGSFRCCVLAA